MRFLTFCMLFSLGFSILNAQELNFKVKVIIPQVQKADPAMFPAMENQIKEFLNSTKWTDDSYEQNEKIEGNLTILISSEKSATDFAARFMFQVTRPVFNSDNSTTIFSYQDENCDFNYDPSQPLIYTKGQYTSNLVHLLAFYANYIIGLDGDSFAPFGGDAAFGVSQEVLNSFPSNLFGSFKGWSSQDGNINRFVLQENINNPRLRPIRNAYYIFHRKGVDYMASDAAKGRAAILDAIEEVNVANVGVFNALLTQIFSISKGNEIVDIFKQGTAIEKGRILQLMPKIDPANSQKYYQIGN
jgi:hypothetical protein